MEAELLLPTHDEDSCPECRSSHLIRDYVRGELVCERCGLVVRDTLIDPGPEWSGSGQDAANKIRTGAPVNVASHDKGLTTEIAPGLRDSQGKPLREENRPQIYRMRKLQKRMRYSQAGERSLAEALMELERLASRLGLPREFRNEAALLYRKAAGKGLVRGRTILGMASAAIYAACRLKGAPRTLEEISSALGVRRRELTLSYKALGRGLGLKLPPPKAADFLRRFSSHLDLTPEVEAKSLELVRATERAEQFHSKGPSGTVAACIYLASILLGQKVPQEKISRVAGVSEVTVRIRYTSIAERLGLEASPRDGPRESQADGAPSSA
ncbi:MAG: transcription initiation factor IIB family protein [Thermoplasmata archaeon]